METVGYSRGLGLSVEVHCDNNTAFRLVLEVLHYNNKTKDLSPHYGFIHFIVSAGCVNYHNIVIEMSYYNPKCDHNIFI